MALNDTALAATHPNQTDAREIWGYYPDDWPLKGLHAGDTRAALTPFLAHQVLPKPPLPLVPTSNRFLSTLVQLASRHYLDQTLASEGGTWW